MELAHDSRVTSLLGEHFVGQKKCKTKIQCNKWATNSVS